MRTRRSRDDDDSGDASDRERDHRSYVPLTSMRADSMQSLGPEMRRARTSELSAYVFARADTRSRLNSDESSPPRVAPMVPAPEESFRLQRMSHMKRPMLWGTHFRNSVGGNRVPAQPSGARGGGGRGGGHSGDEVQHRRLQHRPTLSKEGFEMASGDLDLFKEALLPYIAGSDVSGQREMLYNTGFLRNAWRRAPTINVNFDHGTGQFLFAQDSKVMIIWDIVMVMAIAWTITVTPYELAFLSDTAVPCFFIHMLVDSIFLLDLLVNFNLMFERSDDEGTYEVSNRSQICASYLQGWFVWDAISAFPFSFLPWYAQRRFHGFQQLFRGLRIVRLFRVSKLRRRNLLSRPIMPFWVRQVCILVFISVVSVHLFACTWASLAAWSIRRDQLDDGHGGGGSRSWLDDVIKQKLSVDESIKKSPFQIYTWSVYFSITLITTVGFGDVTPQSHTEVMVATLGVCIGSIIWAYILSSLFTVLSRRDPHRTEFENMMDELKAMMEDHSLPGLLVFDVQNYFCECEKLWKLAKRRSYLIERMSPMLRGRVSLALCAEWIAKVGYIRELFIMGVPGTTSFVAEIASKLEAAIYSAGEKLEALAIYIIRKGVVGQGSRVLSVGDVCGADFLVQNPQNRLPFYPVSLTMTGTLLLHRRDFDYVLKRFPSQAKSIRMYTVWLAMKYGLARELRRAAARKFGYDPTSSLSFDSQMIAALGASKEAGYRRTSTGLSRSTLYSRRGPGRGATVPELDDILSKLDALMGRMDDVSARVDKLSVHSDSNDFSMLKDGHGSKEFPDLAAVSEQL